MCTLSWRLHAKGYQVFFNRDEYLSRPSALPPQKQQRAGVTVLMPQDPVGYGSWLSLNETGQSLCLLNYYPAHRDETKPKASQISRGEIVVELSSLTSLEAVASQLERKDLCAFLPFTLVVFQQGLTQQAGEVVAFFWDGDMLEKRALSDPLMSTVLRHEDLQTYQANAVSKLNASKRTERDYFDFQRALDVHQMHQKMKWAEPQTATVSFTQIDVQAQCCRMSYAPYSPAVLADHQQTAMDDYDLL